jgi:hypothetical protein
MNFIREELKKTNLEFRMHLPKEEIEFFAESRFSEGVDTIFAGHFHQEYLYHNRKLKKMYVLPKSEKDNHYSLGRNGSIAA